jgi:pyruvate dehydrogenase E1 component alpha subunit
MEARLLQGRMIGFYHSAKGGIAPGVGLCSLLNKDDNLSPHHRAHGIVHMLSKGIDVKYYVAEHSGKLDGCCAGRSSYHFSFPEDKVYLMSGFIGYSPGLSVGWGWAAKQRRQQQVVACCIGDGSFAQGRTHESFIFANINKLPIIYLCENNGMNQFVSTEVSHPVEDYADLAKGYGMPSVIVDGQDVFAVAEAAQQAIKRARSGGGPTLIEAKTMRATSHAVGLPDWIGWEVRDAQKVAEEYARRNPLLLARERVLDEGLFTAAELEKIDEDVQAEFDDIEIFVDGCADAELTTVQLLSEVYA